MTTLENWNKYWENQISPKHRSDAQEHYQQYAAELGILFGNKNPDTVLEIGCGNGDLYKQLGFNHAHQYKGIDFSPAMLGVFQEKYPSADLECCDGSTYSDDKKYDLIFSNAVIQNFDAEMLHRHFANARKMMHKNSLFICASVPDKSQKFKYSTGKLSGGNQPNILQGYTRYIKGYIKSFVVSTSGMGMWYNLSDFIKMSGIHNMSIEFYGSMHYMYRFHAVMKIK